MRHKACRGRCSTESPPMQQTILALAAVLIFSLYALTRHESDAGRERITITTEVEMAAAALARERLHEIERRAFDEADVGRDGVRASISGLTPRNLLGPDAPEASEAAFDDIDDFHGSATADTSVWNGQMVLFRDSISVRYFNPADTTASPNQALAKEITVRVRAAPSGYIGSPPVLARLRRVITPTSGAAHSSH